MDETYVGLYPELERDHFWWKIRRELIRALIERRRDLAGVRVLDLGCGSGLTIEFLSDLGATVTGVEIDEGFDNAESPVREFVKHGDFLSLDLGGVFDVVLMLDVLEHIEDEDAALKRVAEVVSPSGLLIVTVPAYGWLWSRHDKVNGHFRRYTLGSLHAALGRHGFVVDQAGYMFAGLVPPKLAISLLERLGARIDGNGGLPGALDSGISKAATWWFRREMEVAIRRRGMLPFGSSVVAVAEPS